MPPAFFVGVVVSLRLNIRLSSANEEFLNLSLCLVQDSDA